MIDHDSLPESVQSLAINGTTDWFPIYLNLTKFGLWMHFFRLIRNSKWNSDRCRNHSGKYNYNPKLGLIHSTHVWHIRIDSESCWIKPNMDCNYNFLIDLEPNGIPLWFPINRKMVITIQIWFYLTRFIKDFSVCRVQY